MLAKISAFHHTCILCFLIVDPVKISEPNCHEILIDRSKALMKDNHYEPDLRVSGPPPVPQKNTPV